MVDVDIWPPYTPEEEAAADGGYLPELWAAAATVVGDIVICDKCFVQWVVHEGCECTRIAWLSVITGILYPRKELVDEAIGIAMSATEYRERWGE